MKGSLKGLIVGDLAGAAAKLEKTDTPPLFGKTGGVSFTGKTVMAAAAAAAIMDWRINGVVLYGALVAAMQNYGMTFPYRGYSAMLSTWIYEDYPAPFSGFDDSVAARCAAAGMIGRDPAFSNALGRRTASPTHQDPETLAAAGLAAELICRARNGATPEVLRSAAEKVLPVPRCSELCRLGAIPQSPAAVSAAVSALLESSGFEDAIFTALRFDDACGSVAALTGALAEARWGVPDELWERAREYVDPYILQGVDVYYAFSREETGEAWINPC